MVAPLSGATTPVPAYDARYASLGLRIENIGDLLSSEVALDRHLDGLGQPPEVVCSWGLGASTTSSHDHEKEGSSAAR